MRRLGPYNPTTGETDDSLPWQDGNPATGQEGSIPSYKHWQHVIEEVVHVIEQAGLTPSAGDLTQLHQAIQTMISDGGESGEGSTGAFVTRDMARGYLPIYPDAFTVDGKLTVTSGGGNVVVAADQAFTLRGVFAYSTTDFELAARTFATVANKTYHLRFDHLNGFRLRDLSNGGYNPGALGEGHQAFDSTYDDMLVARVVTDGVNTATVTSLVNRARLEAQMEDNTVPVGTSPGGDSRISMTSTFALNWARAPMCQLQASLGEPGHAVLMDGYANWINIGTQNRYAVVATAITDTRGIDDPIIQFAGQMRLLAFR